MLVVVFSFGIATRLLSAMNAEAACEAARRGWQRLRAHHTNLSQTKQSPEGDMFRIMNVSPMPERTYKV